MASSLKCARFVRRLFLTVPAFLDISAVSMGKRIYIMDIFNVVTAL